MDNARGGGGDRSKGGDYSEEGGIQSKSFKPDGYGHPRVSSTTRSPSNASPHHSRRPSAAPLVVKPQKYLLHVVPPASIPHDPPHPKISPLAAGYGPRFARGTLIPLYPTLHAQLGAIAREYGLPSTGGLCVYLVSTQDPSSATAAPMAGSLGMAGEAGPRVGEEAWACLFGRLFEEAEEERPLGHRQGGSFTEDDEAYPPVPSIPSSYRSNIAQTHPDAVSPYSPAVSPQHTRQYTEGDSSIISEGDVELESDAGGSADSATTGFSKSAQRVFSTSQSSATSRSAAGPSPNLPSPSARYSAHPNPRNDHMPRRSLAGASYDGFRRSSRSSTYGESNAGLPARPPGGLGWGASVIVGKVEFDIDRRNVRGKWFDGFVESAEAGSPLLPLSNTRSMSMSAGPRPGSKSAEEILQGTLAHQPVVDSPRRGLYLPSLVDMRQRQELSPPVERHEEEREYTSSAMDTPEMRVRTTSGRSRQVTPSLSGYSIAQGFANDGQQRASFASATTADTLSIRDAVRASFESNGYAMLNDEEETVMLSPAPSRRESLEPSQQRKKNSVGSERSWKPLDDQPMRGISETKDSTDVEASESDGTVQAGLGIVGVASPPRFTGLFVEARGESDDEASPPQDDIADIVQLLSANRAVHADNLASPIQLSATFEQQATFPSGLLVQSTSQSAQLDAAAASPALSSMSTDDIETVTFLPRNSMTRSQSNPLVLPESPSPRASFRSPQRMGGQDWTNATQMSASRWAPNQSSEALEGKEMEAGEPEEGLRMELDELEEKLGQLSPRTREEAVALLLEDSYGRFGNLNHLAWQSEPSPPVVDSSSYSASPTRSLSPPSPVITTSQPLPSLFESEMLIPPIAASRVPRSSSLETSPFPLPGPPIARSTAPLPSSSPSPTDRTPTSYGDMERFPTIESSPTEAPPVPLKIHFAPIVPPVPLEPPTPTQSNRLLRAAGKSLKLSKPSSEAETDAGIGSSAKSPRSAFFDKKAFGFLKKQRKSSDSLSESTSPTFSNVSLSSEAFPPNQPNFGSAPSPRRPSNPFYHDTPSPQAASSTLPVPPRPYRTESTESFATAFSTAPDDLNASTTSTIRNVTRSREEEYASYRSSGVDEAELENLRPTRYKVGSVEIGISPRGNYGPSTPLGLLPQNQRSVPVTPSFDHRRSRKSSGSTAPAPFVTPSTTESAQTPKTTNQHNLGEERSGPTLTSSSSKYRLSEDLDLVDLLKQMESIYDTEDEGDMGHHDGGGTGDSTRQFETSFSESSLSSLATGQASDESTPVDFRMVSEVARVDVGERREREDESLL